MNKKPHILLIDDDEVMDRLIGAKLSAAGYELIYAQDGRDGREKARRFHPDLILLDIRMPELGGYKLAELLKSEEQTRDIPIAFLSNEDLSIEGEKWAKERWVVDYIHKSIGPEEFIQRIKKILEKQK